MNVTFAKNAHIFPNSATFVNFTKNNYFSENVRKTREEEGADPEVCGHVRRNNFNLSWGRRLQFRNFPFPSVGKSKIKIASLNGKKATLHTSMLDVSLNFLNGTPTPHLKAEYFVGKFSICASVAPSGNLIFGWVKYQWQEWNGLLVYGLVPVIMQCTVCRVQCAVCSLCQ